MIDFEIQRCSRKCAATERELAGGEICYSVLLQEGAQVVRRDYSQGAWHGAPAEAIAWWQTTIVDPNAGRPHWAPNDVMLDYLERLIDDPAAADSRYVLALLLVRRRVLRLEGTEPSPTGETVLVLHSHRNDAQYRVLESPPTPERSAAIQEQLALLLQTHGR